LYRCLIVDDEPRICYGLQQLIPWESLGYSSPDVALYAEEAIRMHDEHDYHLILTDIRMPGTDGLEFIRLMRLNHADVHFIIISGYGEFEYARTALSYNVDDYLLKPVNEIELQEQVSKIAGHLDQIRNDRESRQNSRRAILTSYMQECLNSSNFDKISQLSEMGTLCESDYPLCFLFAFTSGGARTEAERKLMMQQIESMDRVVIFPVTAKTAGFGILLCGSSQTEENSISGPEELNRILMQYDPLMRLIVGFPAQSPHELPAAVSAVFRRLEIAQLNLEDYETIIYTQQDTLMNIEFARIVEYIKHNFCKEITIKSVASLFFINQVYFGRLFKKTTGMKFSDYINRLRINLAADVLKDRHNKVADVCRQVGYRDVAYFYRKFKQIKGRLPLDHLSR
jgi:YesN/AraC family two-component response regulator